MKLSESFSKAVRHNASTQDVGIIYDAMNALHNLKIASTLDVLYMAEMLNTMILIDSFSAANGSDSKLGGYLKD